MPRTRRPQTIEYPGLERDMTDAPRDEMRAYQGRGLLDGKVALVTGGDSDIGRAVSIAFAKEGAEVAVAYLSEHPDAERTRECIEAEGRRCARLAAALVVLLRRGAVPRRRRDHAWPT